jgi:hypothetical protein
MQPAVEASAPEPAPAPEPVHQNTLAPAQPAPKPVVAPEPPKEQVLSLLDAARRFAVGFKEHWYPSILQYAKTHGHKDHATESQCKSILRGWGATLK